MGIVFHTATFDEDKTAAAVQQLRQDSSWITKVARMNIPNGAGTLGHLVRSPTTLATETEANDEEEGNGEASDGVTMPAADTGCWHHKVCFKPVDTDE